NKEETPQDKAETEPETQTADSVEEPTVEITEKVEITEEPPNKEETPQDKAETEPETQTADSVEAPATDTTEEEGGTQ
ncbi:MAG: hypothetical protein ACE10J_02010, partial [Thermodesulfobacteriota bacterium]